MCSAHALAFAAPDGWKEDSTIRTGHRDYVCSAVFSSDSKVLVTSGCDGRIRFWDVQSQRVLRVIDVETRPAILPLALSRDGKRVASGMRDGIMKTWDVSNGKNVGTFKTDGGLGVTSVAFSSDGKLLASGALVSKIVLWNVTTGREEKAIGTSADVLKIAFSPRGPLLAVGLDDGRPTTLWNTTTNAKEELVQRDAARILDLAFSPDSTLLAMAQLDRPVILWDTRRRSVQLTLDANVPRGGTDSAEIVKVPSRDDTRVAFSPDGRLLASGDLYGDVHLWEVSSGRLIQTLTHAGNRRLRQENPTTRILCLAFSQDGNVLASGGDSESVTLWTRNRKR
jgi:WD40 repeat protein